MLKWGNESYSKLRDNIWKKEYLLQRHKCGSMHGVSKAHPSLGMELQKKGGKKQEQLRGQRIIPKTHWVKPQRSW